MFSKKLPRSLVRLCCRRRVVVGTFVPRERVLASNIGVDDNVRLTRERSFDLCLSLRRNELVVVTQMHQQRGVNAVRLPQVLVSLSSVICHCRINLPTGRRQERHQRTETKTHRAYLPRSRLHRACSASGRDNVAAALLSIEGGV